MCQSNHASVNAINAQPSVATHSLIGNHTYSKRLWPQHEAPNTAGNRIYTGFRINCRLMCNCRHFQKWYPKVCTCPRFQMNVKLGCPKMRSCRHVQRWGCPKCVTVLICNVGVSKCVCPSSFSARAHPKMCTCRQRWGVQNCVALINFHTGSSKSV
jgi:hypothetical protein